MASHEPPHSSIISSGVSCLRLRIRGFPRAVAFFRAGPDERNTIPPSALHHGTAVQKARAAQKPRTNSSKLSLSRHCRLEVSTATFSLSRVSARPLEKKAILPAHRQSASPPGHFKAAKTSTLRHARDKASGLEPKDLRPPACG